MTVQTIKEAESRKKDEEKLLSGPNPDGRRRALEELGKLYDVVAALRGEGGCEWDRAQTHKSLKPYLIEEAYETADAITAMERGMGSRMLKEELGDLLYHVMLHSEIAGENGEFSLAEVAEGICRKMVHRHPTVFSDGKESGRDWETLKKEEKQAETPQEEMERVPHCFPALLRTQKVQKKMERYDRETETTPELVGRAKELLEEFGQGMCVPERAGGELLYEICRILGRAGIQAEQALQDTLEEKLEKRRERKEILPPCETGRKS